MKFTFFTDAHITGQNPEGRSDNYAESILNKIEQIYNKSEEYGSDFVLFGGDLFNTHKIYSYRIIENLVFILKRYKIKTYFVIGQHDLYGYEKNSYNDSALCFIEKMSDGLFVKLESSLLIKKDNIECVIHPFHVYDNINDMSKMKKDGRFNIALVHALLSDKKMMFDTIQIDNMNTDFNLILSGDLHDGYSMQKIGDTSFYNPGAIARIKRNDGNRSIKIGLFEITKNLFDYELKFDEYKLQVKHPSEIFYDKKEVYVSDFNGFINEIDSIEQSAIDIFDLIELWIKTNNVNVDKSLINYILKFRKNEC